jgi:hypothetical protein
MRSCDAFADGDEMRDFALVLPGGDEAPYCLLSRHSLMLRKTPHLPQCGHVFPVLCYCHRIF